ncbi:chemotaxis protein CheB [Roseospirillum parvum]|uniref:protein-glutamate O-methyltransferase n=1 Tax=Roseospirillum parvum TaxID=83401 RepID=A0A1G7UID1_9PROT|nr:chemotaxis protein CheB [Roseospirillum parvum]SDG47315.1 two-component system, chemotaxis family, CheB/CheR fusion protein [Roseospirillum parvum]
MANSPIDTKTPDAESTPAAEEARDTAPPRDDASDDLDIDPEVDLAVDLALNPDPDPDAPDDDPDLDPDAESETDADSETGEDAPARRGRGQRRKKLIVVGIAASAGGLEALGHLITNLPPTSPMAYVVVQHMAPQHPSMLTQLLSRQTQMKVVDIKDGQRLEADTVYITPPNHDLDISDGQLLLREPHAAVGPKPSVDYFFTALAEDQGENAVGIILSGTGSDGAHGVRAIKAAGGICLAQDEKTARYNGMPKAAIDTGCIDFVLPPDQMGEEILDVLTNPNRPDLPTEAPEESDGLKRLLMMIKRRHGIDFANYKTTTIGRRLKRRMSAVRRLTLDEYIAYVEENPGELEQLRNDILISVTSFFRDTEAFDALARIIPDIVKTKKPGDSIRVWVPGCASGEEAYSLAILLAETLGSELQNYQVQIFATDVDADALGRARKAVYSDAQLKNISKEMLKQYFVARSGFFQVVKYIRDMIVFAKHDLIQDPPFLRIDLISCRNLLIYFNNPLQTKIINIFHYALNPGKYLMLGKSESVGAATGQFHTVDKKWKIYRRLGEARQPTRDLTDVFQPRPGVGREQMGTAVGLRREMTREPTLADLAANSLLAAYAPSSCILDTTGRILHIHGDVSPYLSLAPGTPDLNAFSMARREVRGELRTVFVRAQQSGEAATGPGVRLDNGEEGGLSARISVRPLGQATDGNFLVSFERMEPPPEGWGDGAPAEYGPRTRELEQELAATRENLQTVVEELETSNEELQSLNEELQSSNEELQSSNEELETANEELQSTNEELTTVNEELQIKSAELAAANQDLENIQKSVGFPLVVVDKGLRVTRFNVFAKEIFELMPDDVGQTVTSLPCHLDIPGLRDILREVIEAGASHEEDVPKGNLHYWMRFVPYLNEHDVPTGVVMTFIPRTAND